MDTNKKITLSYPTNSTLPRKKITTPLPLVTVDSGAPQGTVLGPILLLLHINDLPSVISSKVRLFADDCLVYREIKSRQDQNDLQKDLNLRETWGSTWG